MVLDKVIDDIVAAAKAEASEMLVEANAQRETILGEAKAKVSDIRKKEEIELNETVRRLKRQEISSAELEAKKIVLSKKKDILDRAFAETLEELRSMPADRKGDLYRRMIAANAEVIDDPRVYCPVGEASLLENVQGIGSVVKSDIKGGLVLENADGTMQVDLGFETVLEGVWESEMKTISEILFG